MLKLRNWKLAILAFLFIGIFTGLGCWQLSRANYKKGLLKSFAERTQQTPLTAREMNSISDLRFYRVRLEGNFDYQHILFLDNKTFHGKVGYEVYIPFKAKGLDKAILVDLGFIPMGKHREQLPSLVISSSHAEIMGMLNLPPTYFALGAINESSHMTWPLRIEFINVSELAKILNYPVFPYILSIAPKDPHALAIEWQVNIMSPEKHMGYALQWFALAVTLLILFVVLNCARKH